jgi:hypothetical protein
VTVKREIIIIGLGFPFKGVILLGPGRISGHGCHCVLVETSSWTSWQARADRYRDESRPASGQLGYEAGGADRPAGAGSDSACRQPECVWTRTGFSLGEGHAQVHLKVHCKLPLAVHYIFKFRRSASRDRRQPESPADSDGGGSSESHCCGFKFNLPMPSSRSLVSSLEHHV